MLFAALVATLAVWLFPASGTGQEVLPEQSALATACAIAQNLGTAQAVPVSSCRRVVEQTDGNFAHVVVSVKVAGQPGRYLVESFLYRSAWGMHTVGVAPAP
jgi:hypothetical protein